MLSLRAGDAMRALWFGAAIGLVAVGTAASAQVTAVVTGGTTTITLTGATTTHAGHNAADQVSDPGLNQAGNYQVVSNLTPNDITFANNATAEGQSATVVSSTRLSITLTNNGSNAVTPQVQTTITPGEFGIFAAESPEANGPFADINTSPNLTGAAFSYFGNSGDPYMAGASFSVDIASGKTTVASYNGSIAITPPLTAGMNSHGPLVVLGGDAQTLLNGFAPMDLSSPTSAVAYQWNATDVLLTLPGGPLKPGASLTFTYDSTVTAFTDGTVGLASGGLTEQPQLQAFAGFGDPIGKGGGMGGGTVVSPDGLSPLTPSSTDIDGLGFSRFSLGLPTFDPGTGMVSLPVSNTQLPSLPVTMSPIGAAVPEPGAWGMMLLGVGMVGHVLRRRRAHAPIRV